MSVCAVQLRTCSQEMSRAIRTHSVSHTPERAAQLSSVALSRFPPEIRKSSGGEKKLETGFPFIPKNVSATQTQVVGTVRVFVSQLSELG